MTFFPTRRVPNVPLWRLTSSTWSSHKNPRLTNSWDFWNIP